MSSLSRKQHLGIYYENVMQAPCPRWLRGTKLFLHVAPEQHNCRESFEMSNASESNRLAFGRPSCRIACCDGRSSGKDVLCISKNGPTKDISRFTSRQPWNLIGRPSGRRLATPDRHLDSTKRGRQRLFPTHPLPHAYFTRASARKSITQDHKASVRDNALSPGSPYRMLSRTVLV